MSEFAMSSPEENQIRKKIGFSSLVLSEFHFFCSFVLSHPLYFSYALFFSPFIFKILSFLSPLFVTTTLLLLALLSTLHFSDSETLETQPSFFFSLWNKLGSVLEHKFDVNVEELEAYKMVAEACSMETASENQSMEICSEQVIFVDKFCSHESTVTCEPHEDPVEKIQPLKSEVEEMEKCEKESKVREKVKPKSELVLDYGEGQDGKHPTNQESKAQKVGLVPILSDFLVEEKRSEVRAKEEDVALKSLGSMRKEKEWRRTLACKLFEERHNADVGQGMDQLWETYETETETEEEKKKQKLKLKLKKKKEVVLEEEEDEEGIDQQQLCCLQALKFSTGKMHMGIAKPNLLKLTKAFKGLGRFYNASKHHKKA